MGGVLGGLRLQGFSYSRFCELYRKWKRRLCWVLSIGSPKVSSVESILRDELDRRAVDPPPELPRVEHGNIRGATYLS